MSYWHGLVTGIAIVGMAVAVAAAVRKPAQGTIDVERINIREPDGTLRMVIAGKAHLPGVFHKGYEIPHPNRTSDAGILFLNDEGTENGGITWSGTGRNGAREASAGLSFDRYENDQTIQILQADQGDQDIAAMVVSDRPAESAYEKIDGISRFRPEMTVGAKRLYVGKTSDRSAIVTLQDAAGKPRLVMKVEADGNSAIQFLDDEGNVVRTIGPDG